MSTESINLSNIGYEIGGAGLRIESRTKEITGTIGKAEPGSRPEAGVLEPKNKNLAKSLYPEYVNIYRIGQPNQSYLLKPEFVSYTWHTHPLVMSCIGCYFLASDRDLNPNLELSKIRNNFVVTPLNNSVSLFRYGKTPLNTKCCWQNAGASEVIPLDWFFNVPDASITIDSIEPQIDENP